MTRKVCKKVKKTVIESGQKLNGDPKAGSKAVNEAIEIRKGVQRAGQEFKLTAKAAAQKGGSRRQENRSRSTQCQWPRQQSKESGQGRS